MDNNEALRQVHKPIESTGGYTPIEKYFVKESVEGSSFIKKTIVNKLGQKRIIFVKKKDLKKEMNVGWSNQSIPN